jgi:hypothetical protein
MGKARSKPRRYKIDREGPSEAVKKYIEQVSNPRTPEDLVLALQNPATPAYKEMMNQMAAKIENIAIIEMLVQRHFIDEQMATQREKDEIQKEEIARDVMNQQKEAIRYNEQAIMANQYRTPLKEEEAVLRKEIEKRKETIRNLETKIHVVSIAIGELKTEGKKIDDEWNKITQDERKAYYKLMEEISLFKADGTEIKPGSLEHKRILLRDMEREDGTKQNESLVKKMDIVAASMLLHAIQSQLGPTPKTSAEQSEKQAEAAPKLDVKDALKNINTDEVAEKEENAENINDQIKQFSDLSDGGTGPSILAAIRLNKEANRIKAQQVAERKQSPEGQKKTQCLKDAINNRKELMINRGELQTLERDKQQNLVQLAQDEKMCKDRFGVAPSAIQSVAPKEGPGHSKRK